MKKLFAVALMFTFTGLSFFGSDFTKIETKNEAKSGIVLYSSKDPGGGW